MKSRSHSDFANHRTSKVHMNNFFSFLFFFFLIYIEFVIILLLCFRFLTSMDLGSQLPGQGSEPTPLHWHLKSKPLDNRGSPNNWCSSWWFFIFLTSSVNCYEQQGLRKPKIIIPILICVLLTVNYQYIFELLLCFSHKGEWFIFSY